MTATEKAFATTLKDIGNAFNFLGVGPAPGSQREYSTAKFNYFYDKIGEEWLAEIDRMLEASNVINERRVAVMVAHLRDVMVDQYEADKANINWYIDNNPESFIR